MIAVLQWVVLFSLIAGIYSLFRWIVEKMDRSDPQAKITIDLADECMSERKAGRIASRYGVRLVGYQEFGPGGSWPVATFAGSRQNLITLLDEVYGDHGGIEAYRDSR